MLPGCGLGEATGAWRLLCGFYSQFLFLGICACGFDVPGSVRFVDPSLVECGGMCRSWCGYELAVLFGSRSCMFAFRWSVGFLISRTSPWEMELGDG